jgi:hypothetical protein
MRQLLDRIFQSGAGRFELSVLRFKIKPEIFTRRVERPILITRRVIYKHIHFRNYSEEHFSCDL